MKMLRRLEADPPHPGAPVILLDFWSSAYGTIDD
jgi:hypothetical protein